MEHPGQANIGAAGKEYPQSADTGKKKRANRKKADKNPTKPPAEIQEATIPGKITDLGPVAG